MFAKIHLIENEICNLAPNSVDDRCSKYDPFLPKDYEGTYYVNSYRRQLENLFAFNNPICNRRC